MKKKVAFTLAELMIVLTVLGVISLMIVPSIMQQRPDEGLLRFKKAYFTLQRTVDAVLNSDVYSMGDLGHPVGVETLLDNQEGAEDIVMPFCHFFAQMLNITGVENCTANNFADPVILPVNADGVADYDTAATNLDVACEDFTVRFVTQDGISWGGFAYDFPEQVSQCVAVADDGISCQDTDGDGEGDTETVPNPNRDIDGFRTDYCPVCIDVDAIGRGEPPFAFGVRNDGRIILGARANEILNRRAGDIDRGDDVEEGGN